MNRIQCKLQPHQLSLDLGSLYTRVCLDDNLVFNQPTCLVKDRQSASIVNFGDKAFELQDKLPPSTSLVFPVKEGVVADEESLEAYLKIIIKKLDISGFQLWLNLTRGSFALPAGATRLDQKILKSVLADVGLSGLDLFSNPDAIYRNWQKRGFVRPESSLLLLDLGEEVADLAVAVDGLIVKAFTLSFGSKQFTEAIKDWLEQEYQLKVGVKTAASIKRILPDLLQDREKEPDKLNVRGVGLGNQMVLTKTVELSTLSQIFKNIAHELSRQIKLSLSQVKSGGLVEAIDNGLYLTGGGSRLNGLPHYLGRELKTQEVVSPTSYTDTVSGLC